MVHALCAILDELHPQAAVPHRADLITFVRDRPGHDLRYAIDATKIRTELQWQPRESFESGLRKTVAWYLAHGPWLQGVITGDYRQWIDKQYGAKGTQSSVMP